MWLLIQPVDDHDAGMIPQERDLIRSMCPEAAFELRPVPVDWSRDLTPWPAPPVFRGEPDFGDGAERTLARLLDLIRADGPGTRCVIGGYSLAGLFALWAGYQEDSLAGVVAASPSVWYPGWDIYAQGRRFRAGAAYLSLGDREEKTRHPVMRTVGDAIRREQERLQAQGVPSALEWNPGNHFQDADRRTAAGFAWIIRNSPSHGGAL